MDKAITAIVPAYNEEETIQYTIAALKQISGISKIIVVDDGSVDGTYNILKEINDVCTIRNNKNKGKGYAIKAALNNVTSKYVLLVDADLGSSAYEIKNLVLNTKISEKVMLVAAYPKVIKKGGFGLVKALSFIGLRLLVSRNFASVLSGQRLVLTDFLRSIELPDDYGLEFKITLECIRNNIDIIEVPLKIHHRETGRDIQGFMHRAKQFYDILYIIIKEMI